MVLAMVGSQAVRAARSSVRLAQGGVQPARTFAAGVTTSGPSPSRSIGGNVKATAPASTVPHDSTMPGSEGFTGRTIDDNAGVGSNRRSERTPLDAADMKKERVRRRIILDKLVESRYRYYQGNAGNSSNENPYWGAFPHDASSGSASNESVTSPWNEPPPVDYSSNGFTISQLLKAGTHLGHTYKRAAMAPFIQGRRNNIFLLDISRTAYRLKQALDVTREIARRGGVILFFNPRESFRELTIQAALRCRQYYAVNPWTEGRLSNRAVLLRSQKYVPDLIILTTLIDATPLVNETRSLNIPTIGICDSNTDPSTVTYPIPGNDDSYPSMELFTSLFSNAAREGLLLGRAQKSLNEDWAKRAMADYQKEERSEMRRPGPRP